MLSIPPTAAGGERCFSSSLDAEARQAARWRRGHAGLYLYNSRVVNRLHGPVVQADWDMMAKWLAALPLTAEQLTTTSWVQPSVANSSGGEQPEEEEGSEGVPALELYEFL